MAQVVNVICESEGGMKLLMEEFKTVCLNKIDRARPVDNKFLMKSGEVVKFYNGANRTSVLGISGLTEEEFRVQYGMETNERHKNIHDAVNKQYKNMGDVADW